MNDVIKALDKATNGKKTFLGAAVWMALTFGVNQGWWAAETVSVWLELSMNLTGIGVIHKAAKFEKKGK